MTLKCHESTDVSLIINVANERQSLQGKVTWYYQLWDLILNNNHVRYFT